MSNELKVTGGEWFHDVRFGQIGSISTNAGDVGVATAQQVVPHDQEHRQVNARLLAASKDLYNVLRSIEGNVTPVEILTFSGYRDIYSVPIELINEVKVLLARLREATK